MREQLDLGFAPAPTLPELAPGAALLRGFALSHEQQLLADLARVVEQAPFRHLVTPGGLRMSVAMTNVGSLGWFSDAKGYRYITHDPESGEPWPALPTRFGTWPKAPQKPLVLPTTRPMRAF